MLKPKALQPGDKIAVVSLSFGILGEPFLAHQLKLGQERLESFGLKPIFMPNALKGIEYLKNNPEARFQDLKQAFLDPEIKLIITAIGGNDTYRIISLMLSDEEFKKAVKNNPKIFIGFSDTTINHLAFYKLGLKTYYGHSFLTDMAELDTKMLPYSQETFTQLFDNKKTLKITSSHTWYEERTDFSIKNLGKPRISHIEDKGYQVLNKATGKVTGKLLGGCLESLYSLLTGDRSLEQKEINIKYQLFPEANEWKDKVIFLETSEEKPNPLEYKTMIVELKKNNVFKSAKALIVGKPQDEKYYEEYKNILEEIIPDLPILYNVNFGHAQPRCIIPIGSEVEINFDQKTIILTESIVS